MPEAVTALLVDDKSDNLFVLEALFERYFTDVNTVSAGDAERGLEIASEHPVDCALVDVQMPGMDGIEMCRRLKADPATRDISVILVTSHRTSASLRVRGLEAGADDFIHRPFDNEEFIARVRVMLRIKRAEADARAMAERVEDLSSARWRGTFDAMSEGVLLLSPEQDILEINAAGCAMTGRDRDQVIGRKCFEVVHGTCSPIDRCPCLLAIDEHRSIVTRVDNGEQHMELSASPIMSDVGQIEGIVHVIKDITEEVEAEREKKALVQRLFQSQKMEAVGLLAGGVAHDFNNLLTVITSYATLILDELPESAPLREDVVCISDAAERASVLTSQLLAFGRRQLQSPRVFELGDVVRDSTRLLERMLGEDVELDIRPAGDLGLVRADPAQLEQVIINLAVNARDAMPQGGRLTIETANITLSPHDVRTQRVDLSGDHVLLAVTDTGCGMDAATIERIFEPFFTTKDVGKGTGLGLSTAYGVVTQSGGAIGIESALGQGTTFSVYLPVSLEGASEPVVPADTVVRAGSELVLLVEDEDAVRRLAERVLTRAGYGVLVAADGAEALCICERQGADVELLLTDVVMPGMSGKLLADELTGSFPAMKVLFMTGYTDDDILRHGVQERGLHIIGKPFDPSELAAAVRRVLEG